MIKRLLLGIVVVVGLVLIAGAVLISRLNVDFYKDKIQQAVFDKTGRQLSIDGEISASFFPWIGLQLNDVSLANAEGFDEVPFAAVQSSDVKLELLPLIAGTLNVNVIELHGLALNLRVNEEGVANWEDLLSTTTVVETQTAEDDVLQSVETGAPLAAALSVGGIVVTDSSVRWRDDKNTSDLTLEEFNLTTDAIQLSTPFDFTSNFKLGSRSLGFDSDVQASGAVELDLATNSYRLSGLNLITSSSGRALPLPTVEASLSGDLLFNLKAQTFDLTAMAANLAGVPVSGELHGTGLLESINLFGELTSGDFDASALLQSAGVTLPAGFDKELLHNSGFDLVFQQSTEQILVNRLALNIGEIALEGDLQVGNLAQSAVLSGQLASNDFNPAPWLAAVGLEAADPLALQNASTSFSIRQSGQLLTLNDLRLTVDEFDLRGHVELTDIYSRLSPVAFELHGTELDVDRYLPATDHNQSTSTEPSDTANGGNELPVELLRTLVLNGELLVDQLQISGLLLSDISIPIRTANQKIEISEAKAALYDGSFFGNATLDLGADEPLLTLTSNISAVQSAPLLTDFLKSTAPISGTGIINLDMLTRGVSLEQWLQQSSGAVSVRFTDGAINGINIGRELRRAAALVAGADITQQDDNLTTDFSELSVSGEVNEGVLFSDDLVFKSPLLRITGRGTVDLAAQQVDYLAQVKVAATTEGQGGADMAALEGLTLPVPVKGSLNDLTVDFAGMVVGALRADFTDQLRAHKQSLLDAKKDLVLKEVEQKLRDQVQQKTDVLLDESKEVVIEQVEEQKEAVVQELRQQTETLQENLQQRLEKGISNLLEK